jgi:hypothetical protein
MPNHIANILTVKGETEKVQEVMKALLNEDGNVTFDNFLPMPEELRGTTSPTKVVTQKEYDEAVKKREEQTKKGSSFLPSLPITEEMQNELLGKYGVDNWYDWALENWGTKWGAYDGYKISDDSVFFNTAWSTPFSAMETLSSQFPEVEITVKFADEDFGYNVGEYGITNGVMFHQDVPEGGSVDAIRMAIEIQGGEYHLGDMIYDLHEEDIDDKYYNTFLQIILEKEMVDEDYPSFVNEYLLQQAVGNEQFEYASKLRDIIRVEN